MSLESGTPEYNAYNRAYYKLNRSRIRRVRKAHYDANKDKHKEWNARSVAKPHVKAKQVAAHKKYYSANKPKLLRMMINSRFKRVYGIDFNEFSRMVIEQLGCCAICKLPCFNIGIDHNHKTNQVRKLLCPLCNQALGLLKERPELCEAAATYLREHSNA